MNMYDDYDVMDHMVLHKRCMVNANTYVETFSFSSKLFIFDGLTSSKNE